MTPNDRFDVALTGSGFAGSILARILAKTGRRVLLLERFEHPRFALGESSTPLAAILLETLAERYDLKDLADLATYGRWSRRLGHLRRGLKRGFTFYSHPADQEWTPGPTNERRLLVAASPNDAIADAHWLRADVDADLVEQAIEAGVDYRDRTHVTQIERVADGLVLHGENQAGGFKIQTGFLVDASGRRGTIVEAGWARPLASTGTPNTRLLFAHLANLPDFESVAAANLEDGPYPDDRAAIHHLIDEGWIYVLPFDHGVASVGLVLESPVDISDPEATWYQVLQCYPTLARQFGNAVAVTPWRSTSGRLAHRLDCAGGDRWLALPGTFAFYDPMFSTGIAWSLAAVERVAALFDQEECPTPAGVERYVALLGDEADHLALLIRGAYRARHNFRHYVAFTQLYFAAASFQEAGRRLIPDSRDWTWQGFLGAHDPIISGALQEAVRRLEAQAEGREFEAWIASAIAPRNLAGLANPSRRNLYPADLETLVDAAALLGLSRDQVTAALPRLRGEPMLS